MNNAHKNGFNIKINQMTQRLKEVSLQLESISKTIDDNRVLLKKKNRGILEYVQKTQIIISNAIKRG
ncbi:MAG: hypothetical protein JJW01_00665 [Alphaproteobacteria bacterium]|nr:hypothetical protein [Rickettsiales bacterium]